MRVDGILWGRRPPSAGGGPVLRRRPALRAGRRQNPPPFRRFVIANGITPRHRLLCCPKPPLQYRLRHPPLPRPYLPPHSLICASIPPASYHFIHRYAHALLLPPFSPASIAPLAVTTTVPATPSLSRLISLACKAPKTPPQDASMQSSRDDKYEPP
jgi:hypothetical protein